MHSRSKAVPEWLFTGFLDTGFSYNFPDLDLDNFHIILYEYIFYKSVIIGCSVHKFVIYYSVIYNL